MKRQKRINWLLIKSEYLTGAKPEELAKKYKVNVSTIRKKILRDGWNAEKEEIERKTMLKAQEKLVDTLVGKQINSREHYRSQFRVIASIIVESVRQNPDPRLLPGLVKALRDCQDAEFKSLAINENYDKSLYRHVDQGTHNTSNKDSLESLSDEDLVKLIEILMKNNKDSTKNILSLSSKLGLAPFQRFEKKPEDGKKVSNEFPVKNDDKNH